MRPFRLLHRRRRRSLYGGWIIWTCLAVAGLFLFRDELPISTGSLQLVGTAPITADIRVIDGDTVAHGAERIRLVGFNTPETSDAKCDGERQLGHRAKDRLRELVSAGGISLEYVHCSCRPGTEGTKACNFGRSCAQLLRNGRNVGDILISEGLAERYVCGETTCPRRRDWC